MEGKYNSQDESSENVIKITHGYSRDHRPDLPQFMIDLMCSSDGDIPLFMRIGNGNEWELSEQKGYKYREKRLKYHGIEQRWLVVESEKRKESDLLKLANKISKEEEKRKSGQFILATNILNKEELSSEEMLEEYKKQQCCERGFRFLKDPLFLTSNVYVKNPKRVEVMGMLMGLCLLVYTIGQRMIRKEIEKRKIGIRNQVNKRTNNPTMKWIFQLFQGIHYVLIDGKECISNLKEERKEILSYFRINCQKYY